MSTVEITGNTFPVREQLKALGGRYRATTKSWLVPAEKADEARTLVRSAGASRNRSGRGRSGVCASCGCRINYGMYCGKCEFSR